MITFKNNGLCKYAQLKDHLISEIQCGKFQADDIFHTERELMEKYRLSYATVSRALREMDKEGFFRRVRGHGTFVTSRGVQNARRNRPAALETLYLATVDIADPKHISPIALFLHEQIQKGIINTYNGPAKFTTLSEIFERVDRGEKIMSIIFNPEVETVGRLRAAGCLYSSINHRRDRDPSFNTNSVSWEMMLGIYDLMSYLIRDLGHTKIGFIRGNTLVYHADRLAGYQIGLKTHNIPEKEEYIIRGLFGYEKDGYDAMKRLLALGEPPTAVFADTDLKAIGAIKAAQDAGMKVPGGISVAGFDDMPRMENLNPLLTTVRIPYYEMGVKAVEMLFARMHSGGADVPGEILKSSLVIRESCGKPGELS